MAFFIPLFQGNIWQQRWIVCERDGKRQGKGRKGCSLLENLDLDSRCAMEQKQAVQKQADGMDISCRVWRAQNSNVELPEYGESTYEVFTAEDGSSGCYMNGYEEEKGKGCKGGKI